MTRFPLFSLRHISGGVVAALLIVAASLHANTTTASSNDDSNLAKNLARMNCGAEIECTTPDGRIAAVMTADGQNKSAAALIMDDDTVSCPLEAGETTFVIKLPTTSLLDRFTFVNENAAAAGQLKISVSNYKLPAASPKWQEVDGSITFTRKRLFNLSMLGVEARYVRLSFQVEKPGRIASLGLYGGETLERFALRQQQVAQQLSWIAPGTTRISAGRAEDHLNFNFANSYAKGRVVYVSSGPLASARRMIDDDNETGFHFAADDAHPTVIVELAQSSELRRVSALYTMKTPGRLDVYLLNKINDDTAENLDQRQPVASATDGDGDGKAAVDFETRGAKYVALRFTPETAGRTAQNGFAIAEIDAFGDVPLAFLNLSAPDVYASNSSALQFPGDGGPDLSNRLGTMAIPPTLPEVSP
jgi:hypothetical protein